MYVSRGTVRPMPSRAQSVFCRVVRRCTRQPKVPINSRLLPYVPFATRLSYSNASRLAVMNAVFESVETGAPVIESTAVEFWDVKALGILSQARRNDDRDDAETGNARRRHLIAAKRGRDTGSHSHAISLGPT